MKLLVETCALATSLSDAQLAEAADPNIEKMLLYFAQAVADLSLKAAKQHYQASHEEILQLGACCSECALRDPVLLKILASVADDINRKKLMTYLFETTFTWTQFAETEDIDKEIVKRVRVKLFSSLVRHPSTAILRIFDMVCALLLLFLLNSVFVVVVSV